MHGVEALIVAAWRELQECASWQGDPSRYATFSRRPPAWFVQFELGFSLGPGDGPSLSWTCDTLKRHNRLALAATGGGRATYPKEHKNARR